MKRRRNLFEWPNWKKWPETPLWPFLKPAFSLPSFMGSWEGCCRPRRGDSRLNWTLEHMEEVWKAAVRAARHKLCSSHPHFLLSLTHSWVCILVIKMLTQRKTGDLEISCISNSWNSVEIQSAKMNRLCAHHHYQLLQIMDFEGPHL